MEPTPQEKTAAELAQALSEARAAQAAAEQACLGERAKALAEARMSIEIRQSQLAARERELEAELGRLKQENLRRRERMEEDHRRQVQDLEERAADAAAQRDAFRLKSQDLAEQLRRSREHEELSRRDLETLEKGRAAWEEDRLRRETAFRQEQAHALAGLERWRTELEGVLLQRQADLEAAEDQRRERWRLREEAEREREKLWNERHSLLERELEEKSRRVEELKKELLNSIPGRSRQ